MVLGRSKVGSFLNTDLSSSLLTQSSTCCIVEGLEDVKGWKLSQYRFILIFANTIIDLPADIVHRLEDNCRNSRIPNFTPTWTSPSCPASVTSASSPSAPTSSSSYSHPYPTSIPGYRSDGNNELSIGIIIGIVVAVIIFIAMMWAAFKLWQKDKARKEILKPRGRAHLAARTSIPTRNATRSYPAGTPARPSRARTQPPRASTPPPPPPYVEREADPKQEPAPPRYEV